MSSSAHRGDDDIAFYAADIGETRLIAADAISNQQTTDADGPLLPGRWVIQIHAASSNALVWIGLGKFVAGSPLGSPVGPGLQRIPLCSRTIVAVETNVIKDFSDRVVARTSAGTANVWLTRISRGSTLLK